ncbi:GNAT family N-acetyltransferase [Algiphilus sp.]|uniref:bifunctional acetate--CoA ligase family protein/GNAT family N-acetyltransferase n=1 Tax=Algiphilus sp. TaxID=1872431 RepID=UPI003C6635BD
MTTRNLDAIFRPRRIALFGASEREPSVGSALTANLLNSGFGGSVDLVNPRYESLHGHPVHADVAALSEAPDLAVIATPPESVPDLVAELAARGTRGAIVITAGFEDLGSEASRNLQSRMLAAARPGLMRIIGPNSLGVIATGSGLNAAFAHLRPGTGRLAFVTQSGAVISAVLDWAAPRGIGFSHLVSLGDMADVDFGDMLDYLAADSATGAILLYIESIRSARKFMSAARAASRQKPVIAVKAGRFAESARAAATHTGALAGADAVYDAALRRAGIVRVDGLEDLFDAAAILATRSRPERDRLTIVTNGGGLGVLAADALRARGGTLAPLPETARARLDAVLPASWSRANPVDIIGDADAARYRRTLDILMSEPGTDTLLVLNSPTGIADSVASADSVAKAAAAHPRRTVITAWVGAHTAAGARRWLATHGLPSYAGPAQAAAAFMHLVRYRRVQEELLETPPSLPEVFAPNLDAARGIVETALAEGRHWLDADECDALLQAYEIPMVAGRIAQTPAEAAAIAAGLDQPVAVKLLSPDVTHKSEVGGVLLNLGGVEAVRSATAALIERLARERPSLTIDGFLVQPMVSAQHGLELIVGIGDDPVFGPVILFGHGGTAAELIADTALALPPLNMQLAYQLIDDTRVARLLPSTHGRRALDRDALATILVKLAQLVVDLPALRELDINPLLLTADGAIGLDARCRVAPAEPGERLAIRPYPRELEEEVRLRDGRRLLLRPIRPEDEVSLRAGFDRLTPEEIHLRFHHFLRHLPHGFAARLSQIDYDREMALVLAERGPPGRVGLHGVVRLVADPDNACAEFAIIIARTVRDQGVGRHLMERIIEYARSRGVQRIEGDVLEHNSAMIGLARRLGFTVARMADNPGVVRVRLELAEEHRA